MIRYTYVSPESAAAMAEDFYAVCAKVKTRLCAVHFAGAAEGQKKLSIMPPKGLSAYGYRQALLTQAEAHDHAGLVVADEKFRAQIGTAMGEFSRANEKTIARAVVAAIVACDYKL